ncbi:MAG: hypothetical protein KDI71_08675 [Xanthomonadales bacterium]|nr:hypothetical protein [Xanthomonadales bacterium]
MKSIIVALILCAAAATASGRAVQFEDPAWEAYGNKAQLAFEEYLARLRHSRNEQDQTLGLLVRLKEGDEDLGEIGRQWALSEPSSDSVRLAAIWTCPTREDSIQRRFCDQQRLLERWQQIDPDNALVWATRAARADAEGDLQAFADASDKVMAADHFHNGFPDTLKLFRERMAADKVYAQQPRGDRAIMALGIGLAIHNAFYSDLQALCPHGGREPLRTDRAPLCRHLSRLMMASGDGVLSGMIGNELAQAYTLDDSERRELIEWEAEQRELRTQFSADPLHLMKPTEDGFPDQADDFLQLWIKHGEREAMIRWLATRPAATDREQ